jgi:hypothetical protein
VGIGGEVLGGEVTDGGADGVTDLVADGVTDREAGVGLGPDPL